MLAAQAAEFKAKVAHCRCFQLPGHQFRALAQSPRMLVPFSGRYGPHRRAGCRIASIAIRHADMVTTTTHTNPSRPRGGMIFSRTLDLQKKVNSRVFPGIQSGPLMHVIAAKAVAFGEAQKPAYTDYMKRVQASASAMADTFIELGWQVVSGGSDNHLFSLNVMSQGVTGKEAEDLLHTVGITVNKNLIPYDEQPAQSASGIRIGTPAICSRGLMSKSVSRWPV